jgi:hypothetical protein
VLDTNSCSDTLTVTLTQPVSAFTATETHTNILCFGDSTGGIDISANGGVHPYEFSIDSGATYVPDSVFLNLPAEITMCLPATATIVSSTSILHLRNRRHRFPHPLSIPSILNVTATAREVLTYPSAEAPLLTRSM